MSDAGGTRDQTETLEMDWYKHVCTICCRPDVAYDVVSGQNVKTVEGYLAVNFEVASSNIFRDIQRNHFVTAEAAADIDDSIRRKCFRVSLKITRLRSIANKDCLVSL